MAGQRLLIKPIRSRVFQGFAGPCARGCAYKGGAAQFYHPAPAQLDHATGLIQLAHVPESFQNLKKDPRSPVSQQEGRSWIAGPMGALQVLAQNTS